MSTLNQLSFAAGEISPSLQARVDTTRYRTGLKTCRNQMVLRYGGVSSRPGSEFIAQTKNTTDKIRLIPFVQSATLSFVIEFGNQYIRFHRGGSALTLTGVTAWNSATAYTIGQIASLSGVNYYCTFAHTNKTPPNATYWYAMPGNILEIPAPYGHPDLAQLKHVQTLNKIILTHNLYRPLVLTRTSDFVWVLSAVAFKPNLDIPPSPTAVLGPGMTAGGIISTYAITNVDSTGDESFAAIITIGSTAAPSPSGYIQVGATPSGSTASAAYLNIYKQNPTTTDYGFLASVSHYAYNDVGAVPDYTHQPPVDRALFASIGNYPAVASLTQQRLVLASTINQPETVWTSRTGSYFNFDVSTLSEADDAVTFTLSGKQLNTINSIVEMGTLFLFTPISEINVAGDGNGTLTPSSINLKTQGLNGSSSLTPLICGGNILFVQARGNVVRDMFYQFQIDAYRGNELTIFSSHLTEGYTINDWAYQQIPQSIVWMVRSDGILLGLTYVREQEIVGWHRHDFSGSTFNASVENVCSISEGGQDYLYMIVRRYVNGTSKTYVERMATRLLLDPVRTTSASTVKSFPNKALVDYAGADCSLVYDGRYAGDSVKVTGGTLWDSTETLTLTLTSSSHVFSAGDVGLQYFLNLTTTGPVVKFTVTAFSSATVVSAKPDRLVPVNMRSVAVTGVSRAVKTVSNLSHLEGEKVSILADGMVVASPNNPMYPVYTVTSASVTLDRCYAVIRVGLPITCDLEPLKVDSAQGESIIDKKKITTELTITTEKSSTFFAGESKPVLANALDGLTETKIRQFEDYDNPIDLTTDVQQVTIAPSWNSRGSVFIRHVDPTPLSVLSIAGDGLYPFKAGG